MTTTDTDTSPPRRRLIARKDAIELLGVSEPTFHRWVRAGVLERAQLERHEAFYYLDTVERAKAKLKDDPTLVDELGNEPDDMNEPDDDELG